MQKQAMVNFLWDHQRMFTGKRKNEANHRADYQKI